MATVSDRMHESTVGAVRGTWSALSTLLARISRWLAVAAYGVVSAVMLVSAALAAVYLGVYIPGMAGVVVFLTVGLALIGAAPTAARWLIIRSMDAIETSHDADSGEVTDTSGSRVANTTDRGEPVSPVLVAGAALTSRLRARSRSNGRLGGSPRNSRR